MKTIMLMFDSLNRNMLSSYGCDWTHTPNFMRLAQKAVTFDSSFVGSMPCMPARRELHTGRINFLHRSWGPLEPFDDSMPEILKKTGTYTHLVSDHYHYWEDGGSTYHQRYNSWENVRGQEGDHWKAFVRDPQEPEHIGQAWRQDIINRQYMDKEEKQPQSEVFRLGFEFLDVNRKEDNWFLHLETFDPHEPFFAMQHYKDLYPHSYDGPQFDWPPYHWVTESPSAVEHCRNEYAALVSMCDRNLGRLMDYMDQHDMWQDTMLIVNTDHGFLLGEHECWAKCVHPFYNEIAHTPFFVWDPRHPDTSGQRRQSLVQTIDIAPTILGFFNQHIPCDMKGKDLEVVIAQDKKVHEAVLFGLHGAQINITDGRYVYMRAPVADNRPLYEYTLMPAHMRQMFSLEELRSTTLASPFTFTKRVPVMRIDAIPGFELDGGRSIYTNMLFDLHADPGQKNPLQEQRIEARMIKLMIDLMKENDSPEEQYERVGLQPIG